MGENKRSYIPLSVVCLIAWAFLVVRFQRVVFGYAYDTAQSTDCASCHALRKSKAKPGTWAIRKDVVREMDTTEGVAWYVWSCDVCHTDKRADFSKVDTTNVEGIFYPSAHPVPVQGKSKNDLLAAGKKVMSCVNCHDASQVDRGVHSTYVSVFRLRGKGVGYGDPDPVGDTVVIGTDSTSYFWSRPFDSVGARGVVRFEALEHYQGGGSFDTKNPREGKEQADFYPKSAGGKISGLQTIYFCITCHDGNGFPANPTDTSVLITDSTNRIYPPNFVGGDFNYNDSDENDSLYGQGDGGHVIQAQLGTKTGLDMGGRLPCVDCHDSHSSKFNRKLLKDSLVDDGMGFNIDSVGTNEMRINANLCRACHKNTPNNPYYTGGAFKKYGASQDSYLLPLNDTKGRIIINSHLNTQTSCYGFVKEERYVGGCHKNPHKPTMFCNGCHKDHFVTYGQYGNNSHPVGIALTEAPLPGDSLSINDYYALYADSAEVPAFLVEGKRTIDCLTCHNDHSANNVIVDSSNDRQMQAMLRGDAGPVWPYDTLYNTPAGLNNYPNHNPQQNSRLKNLIVSSGTMTGDDFDKMKAMPELCLNCHYRIIGVKNNHGGFKAGGFGMCDKCHSMHGRHPEPKTEGAEIDSTNLIYPLHYGMYLSYDKLIDASGYETGWQAGGYETSIIEWDTSGSVETSYVKKVYRDASGQTFSNRQNVHLIHDAMQEQLCQRCHGNSNWMKIVDTSSIQFAPPQVFFDVGQRADSADTYYTAGAPYKPTNRNKTTHPVDYTDRKLPGNSNVNAVISLRCGSGTKSSGCHTPHGNNNYAQLNAFCYIGGTPSSFKNRITGDTLSDVAYIGERTEAGYARGMDTFCSLCHDRFGVSIFDEKGNYTRHPVGPGVSLLNLYESTDRSQLNSAFFSTLVLDYTDTAKRGDYSKFLAASDSDTTNFVITCVTCHRQHGSPNQHLRKFSDKGVLECVGCHSKSPDILK